MGRQQSPPTAYGGSLLYDNEAAETDEAGLVFQTGFSSRALLGTLGSNNLTLKVLPDGAVFHTVQTVDRFTGRPSFHKHTRLSSLAFGALGSASDKVYEPGCLFSDGNWGFLMRTAQTDPVVEDFIIIDGYGGAFAALWERPGHGGKRLQAGYGQCEVTG